MHLASAIARSRVKAPAVLMTEASRAPLNKVISAWTCSGETYLTA